MAAGTLIGGFLIQKFGRKSAHVLICIPYFLGWIVIYFSTNLEMLLTGRFFTGLCSGIITPATGVYIGETTEPKYRGVLLGGTSLGVSAGLLLSHLLGTFISWQATALTTAMLPLLSWTLMLFTPESPVWLAQKGSTEKAKESFVWLRGNSDAAKQELEVMLTKQKEADTGDAQALLKDLYTPEFLKPMGILVVLFVTSQWSGVNAVNFYSVTLMKQTLGNGINEYLATFIVDCIRLFSSVISCILLKKIGRRPLIISGGIGSATPLFVLAGFLYFSRFYPDHTSPASVFVPIASLMVYIFFVTAGFVSLPWNLLGELLPLSKRSTGSGIASCIAYLSIFSVVKTMPEMFAGLGPHGTFLVYGFMALAGTIFAYFALPETKGKTLNDIEEYFRGNSVTGGGNKNGA